MKKLAAQAALVCAITVMFTGMLMAGALDRQSVQTRTNPAVQSMVRVPGVVGMEQFAAMGTIQQAGLSVSVLPSKKTPKSMKGAEGMEGRVVSQTPASGGMAMYGTAVTIYVNKPKSGDASTSTSTWGTGTATTGYSTQPTYTGTTTGTLQQTYVPTGSATTQTQTSQPFQVQQYYYPSATGTATTQDQQPATGQPATDPNASQQATQPAASVPLQ